MSMSAGQPTKYKPEYCQALIEHMEKGGSFASFAAVARVCIDTVFEWAKIYPEFSDAKKQGTGLLLAFDERVNALGRSGNLKRLVSREPVMNDNGTQARGDDGKPLFKEVYENATFAQTYSIFLMKNRYPRLYRDKIQLETTDKTPTKLADKFRKMMADPTTAEAARMVAEKLSEDE